MTGRFFFPATLKNNTLYVAILSSRYWVYLMLIAELQSHFSRCNLYMACDRLQVRRGDAKLEPLSFSKTIQSLVAQNSQICLEMPQNL